MDHIVLRDGTRLVVRPICPVDGAALVALHGRLSADTIYRRYFGARPHLSPADVDRFTDVAQEWRFALVAVREHGELVAVTRYEGQPDTSSAEIAIVVDDLLQHQGIGRQLLERLVHIARENGLRSLQADVLSVNSPMMALLRSLGLPSRTVRDGGTQSVTVDLTALAVSEADVERARTHVAAARRGRSATAG